jgi:hypothetical protein
MTGGILQLVATGIDSIFLTSNPTITLFKTVYKRYTNFSLLNKLHLINNCTEFNTKGQYILKKEADCVNKMYFEIDIDDFKLEYPLATNQNIITLFDKYNISTNEIIDISKNYVYTIDNYNQILLPIIENKLLSDVKNFNQTLIDLSNNNFIANQDKIEYDNMINDSSGIKIQIDSIYLKYKNAVTDYNSEDINKIDDNPYSTNLIITKTDVSGNLKESGQYSEDTYKIYKLLMIIRNIYLYRQNYNGYNNILNSIILFCDEWLLNNVINNIELNNSYLNKLNSILINSLEINNVNNLFEMSESNYNLNKVIHLINDIILVFTNYYNTYINVDISGTQQGIKNKIAEIATIFNYISYFKNLYKQLNIINSFLLKESFIKIQRKILIDYLYIISRDLYNKINITPLNYKKFIDIFNNTDTQYIYIDIETYIKYLYNEILDYNDLVISNIYSKKIFEFNIGNNYENNISYMMFDIMKKYCEDLIKNNQKNKKLLTYSNVNDIAYNNYLDIMTKTYSSGYNILDTDNINILNIDGTILNTNYESKYIYYMFDNLIRLFIIENATLNNNKFKDSSGNIVGNNIVLASYIGQTLLDYYKNKIIENTNEFLPILKNYIDINNNTPRDTTKQYLSDDTYLIMVKYLTENNKIIYDDSIFDETFVNIFLSTMKINLLQNIYILIEIIIHTLLSNFYHDVIEYYNNGKIKQIDYFKLGYHKTFYNNVSTSNKITSLKGSTISGLHDNITSLFDTYIINDSIYPIYFSRDIIKNLTQFDINNYKIFENELFIPYFNDLNIWKKILLNSDTTKNILQNLSFDNSGNLINKMVYIDVSGIAYDRTIEGTNYYINPIYNIYDKFIATNSNNLFTKNLIILNYIPLFIIRDIATEIYNEIEKDMSGVDATLIGLTSDELLYFDFRDFDERDSINFGVIDYSCNCFCQYEPTMSRTEQYKIIKENQEFKMDLYKKILLNVILKQNNLTSKLSGAFSELVFEKNYYQIADILYFITYSNTYLSENQKGIIGLMRPENLINIAEGNSNVTIEKNSSNIPCIRGIVERYRIKLYNIINNIDKQDIYKLKPILVSKIDTILDNYIKFDNIDNLSDLKNYYESYINNGYEFTQTSYTNFQIYTPEINQYCHAASSIWSYINTHLISNYNLFYNDTLLGKDYYENTLGNFMGSSHEFIKNQFESSFKYYTKSDSKNNLYSYDYSSNYIKSTNNLYYENKNTLINTFPVYSEGFDFYSIGNKYDYSNNMINIIQDFDFSKLTIVTTKNYNQTNQNNNPILNYNNDFTILDFAKGLLENKLYNDIKKDYSGQNSLMSNINNLVIPYYSNILKIRNKKIPKQIYTISGYLAYINDYTHGYCYSYSDCENRVTATADEITKHFLELNYDHHMIDIVYKHVNGNSQLDIYDYSIPEIIEVFDASQNLFQTAKNTIFESLSTVYDKYHPFAKDLIKYYNETILPYIEKYIYNEKYITRIFKDYRNISDVGNYIQTVIIKLSQYNYLYDLLESNIELYKQSLYDYFINNKNSYIKSIVLLTTPINKNININTDFIIKYNKRESFIPFFHLFYLFPFYLNIDIMFRNSDLDILLRHMIEKTPVEYSWVPELGHYLFEYIEFYLDEYLIDSYNSNLQSLYNKLYRPIEHKRGYNIMIGNIEKYTTFDKTNKSKVKLFIPLTFYFCKSIPNSIPMINLLYTEATIRFKLRKLEDLLIYDKNAVIKKKPKLICKMSSEYVYLEEDERKKVSSSRMEFLFERFRYGNIFYYNLSDIINNKILTKVKLSDPTKYILWRIKINQINTNITRSPIYNYTDMLYENNKKLTWHKNGFVDSDGNLIDIIKYIKIYFNDSVREKGKPMLFNNINPYARYIGSLENDEYLYSFSLYPMLEQPSGSANLSQIENLSFEHEFTQEFIDIMKSNGLQIEIEYWALTYNVLRFISGMAAPLFYT